MFAYPWIFKRKNTTSGNGIARVKAATDTIILSIWQTWAMRAARSIYQVLFNKWVMQQLKNDKPVDLWINTFYNRQIYHKNMDFHVPYMCISVLNWGSFIKGSCRISSTVLRHSKALHIPRYQSHLSHASPHTGHQLPLPSSTPSAMYFSQIFVFFCIS